ncbi:MAG: hypothetical protein RL226_1795 [Bacteroidota bacterium]|jgi:PKD repeat protein
MSNKLTGFEKGLVKAMENHQMPYNPESWNSLNARLGGGVNRSSWIAAAMTVVVLTGGAAWYYMSSDNAASAHKASISEFVINKDSFAAIRMKTIEAKEWSASEARNAGNSVSAVSQTPFQNQSLTAANHNANSVRGNANPIVSNNVESVTETVNPNSENTMGPVAEIPAMGGHPAIPIAVDAREACAGTSVSFSIALQVDKASYLWNFGDGNFSNKPNPEHTYTKPGVYDITLSVTSPSDGLIRTTTIDNMIVVNPSPDADFTWEFVTLEGKKPVVKLNNQSQKADQCEWTIAEGDANGEINPVYTFTKNGVNIVELNVSNEFGCTDKKVKAININEDYALIAPESISPNGDGSYDVFMPSGLTEGRMMFELLIFDGKEQIFRTTSAKKPWDGRLPNGTVAEVGSHFNWVAIVYQKNGDQKFYSGDLSVTP